MYIEPNTNIRILKNVPLDTSYNHTIHFFTSTQQSSYFSGLTKHNLTGQTYQRVQKGIMRVGVRSEALYDCNYLMFQNTSFGTKWFYAFITGVEYINNEVSEISFELDVIQTWLFDYQLGECYVERMHLPTDVIGENTVPEPVPVNEYVTNESKRMYFTDWKVAIQYATRNESRQTSCGGVYGNIYSGLEQIVVETFNTQSIQNVISTLIQDGNDIISVYMTPDSFKYSQSETVQSDINVGDDLNGYVPKNKKLFTYPYNFANVYASNGNSVDYQFELGFEGTFRLYSTCVNQTSCILVPLTYKNLLDNIEYGIAIDNFPVCSWSENGYLQYFAQQGTADAIKGIASVALGATTSIATGNPFPAIHAGNNVLGKITDVVNIGRQPQKVNGNTSNNNILTAFDKFGYNFSRQSIRKEYAKIIDDFFSVYGYAVKQCMYPSVLGRPHWNYIQTKNCLVKGSVPADDMKKIVSIYDSGITFWKNGNEVGDYSLDNSPNSGV